MSQPTNPPSGSTVEQARAAVLRECEKIAEQQATPDDSWIVPAIRSIDALIAAVRAESENEYKAGVRHAEEVEAGREVDRSATESVWFQRGFAWFYAMLLRHKTRIESAREIERLKGELSTLRNLKHSVR